MKTIFDQATRAEVIARIETLSESSQAQWGKMNVTQMIIHCAQWDEMALGKKTYKQSLLGKLFGKRALRDMLNEKPIKKNLPTVPSFVVKEGGPIAPAKRKWIQLVEGYEQFPNEGFIHPFFGLLSKEHTGYLAYKHADHHLRQFGA